MIENIVAGLFVFCVGISLYLLGKRHGVKVEISHDPLTRKSLDSIHRELSGIRKAIMGLKR